MFFSAVHPHSVPNGLKACVGHVKNRLYVEEFQAIKNYHFEANKIRQFCYCISFRSSFVFQRENIHTHSKWFVYYEDRHVQVKCMIINTHDFFVVGDTQEQDEKNSYEFSFFPLWFEAFSATYRNEWNFFVKHFFDDCEPISVIEWERCPQERQSLTLT